MKIKIGENMKAIFVIFIILNLMINPIGIVIAEESQNPIQIEVLTYKIGDRSIDTTTSKDISNIASIESKTVDELKGQPILNVKSELSSNKENKKIILRLNIENIGDVKAKNIEAKSNPGTGAEALYIKGGKISKEGAVWTGDIEAKGSQELIYELNYNGKGDEDLKIPLVISGSGSEDWIMDLVIIIFKWWLKSEFGIDIPVGPKANPGFEIILGISVLISISYLINKKLV